MASAQALIDQVVLLGAEVTKLNGELASLKVQIATLQSSGGGQACGAGGGDGGPTFVVDPKKLFPGQFKLGESWWNGVMTC